MLFIIYLPLFFLFLCAWCSVTARLRGFSSWFKRPKISRGTYLPPRTDDAEEYFKEYEKYLAEYRAYLAERNRVYGVKK